MATDTNITTIQAAFTARTAMVGFVPLTATLPKVALPVGTKVTVSPRFAALTSNS